MSEILLKHESLIFHEMMSHPALFTHPHPQTVAIIGDEEGNIAAQILQHHSISEVWRIGKNKTQLTETRIKIVESDISTWIKEAKPDSFDIIISVEDAVIQHFLHYFATLRANGILVQKGYSPFQLDELKTIAQHLQLCGFSDLQILSFPQPHFTSGWRSALMAIKLGSFNRVREKDIYNKSFKTHYYNFDAHKAALVLPEFMREEWIA